MNSLCSRLASLGMAGLCLGWVGIGGIGFSSAYSGEEKPGPAPEVKPAVPTPAPAPPIGVGVLRQEDPKADFKSPYTAVKAFLAALKALDPARLAAATSLRAPVAARRGNRPLFTAILERSLAGEELMELALKLEGYKIVDHMPPTATGTFTLILMKPGPQNARVLWMMRTCHEKSGWKVEDIYAGDVVARPILIPRAKLAKGGPALDRFIPADTQLAVKSTTPVVQLLPSR